MFSLFFRSTKQDVGDETQMRKKMSGVAYNTYWWGGGDGCLEMGPDYYVKETAKPKTMSLCPEHLNLTQFNSGSVIGLSMLTHNSQIFSENLLIF